MPLMDLVIQLACENSFQNHMDACQKAFEASTKSSQLYQTEEKAENYFTLLAKNSANNYVGKESEYVISGLYFGYKTYKNKAIDLKLYNGVFCDKITAHAGADNYNLGFSWKLW